MDQSPALSPLYLKILGKTWDDLPQRVRELHDITADQTAYGVATVKRGRGLLARVVAMCMGFPKPGDKIPVKVAFRVTSGQEVWARTFGDKSFTSYQRAGTGSYDGLLYERFGPVGFGLELVLDDSGKLHLKIRRWNILGIPMPVFFAPHGDSYEYEENGRFCFYVVITHPITGLIVHYKGRLEPFQS